MCDRDKTLGSWRGLWDHGGICGIIEAVRKELPLTDAQVEGWDCGEMLSCSRSMESVPDVFPGATAGWRL